MDRPVRPRTDSYRAESSIERTRRLLADPETRDTALLPHLPPLYAGQAEGYQPTLSSRRRSSGRTKRSFEPQDPSPPELVCVPEFDHPEFGLRRVTSRDSPRTPVLEGYWTQVFAEGKNFIDNYPRQYQDYHKRLNEWAVSISPEDPPTHCDEERLAQPPVYGLRSGPRPRRATSPALSAVTAVYSPITTQKQPHTMDASHLDPYAALDAKAKQIQDAKDMQQLVNERSRRTGIVPPPYEFLELIGKGGYGRVYKCKHKETREIVAVKIMDVDELDYQIETKHKDAAIEDFIKEVNALKRVKDSKARNINHIHEAFDLHSQLWIVSDYCSGGSVHTLLKCYGPHGGASPTRGLDEEFIIAIARELAIALKHVHDAGVLHRDIKCGNILISEDGHVQLCDFGIAARMENDVSKRATIIGTPYWMAPEMQPSGSPEASYGLEIDCWAYGCTVYEMATGLPPNSKFAPQYLPTVLRSAPRLEEDKFSPELCEFVEFCLQSAPEDRPTAQQIMEHPYIANTELEYPTTSLRSLIDKYVQWERKGGQRQSLFNAFGAAAPQVLGAQKTQDDWIFSTTADFDKDYERRHSRMPLGIAAFDFAGSDAGEPPAQVDLSFNGSQIITPFEAIQQESRANRGERYLEKLFNPSEEQYEYDSENINAAEEKARPLSDLPLRNFSNERAANRETLIDLDTSGLDMPKDDLILDIDKFSTVKGGRRSIVTADDEEEDSFYATEDPNKKRGTMQWKFPSLTVSAPEDDDNSTMKRATKDWTFPSSFDTPIEESADDVQNIANRRTMDWTFETAGTAGFQTEAETSIGGGFSKPDGMPTAEFRPQLTRVVTEPIGQFNDFMHPPEGSLDAGRVAARESIPMIDLDLGDDLAQQQTLQPDFIFEQPTPPEEDMMRSSSPLSMTHSMTSLGPFDLEQDPDRREDDMRRLSYNRNQQQHPNNGPSVAERRASRFLHANHGSGSHANRVRGASIDSTASSVADESADIQNDYKHSIRKKMHDQLRNGLQRTASETGSRVHGQSNSYGDIDTDSQSGRRTPRLNNYGYDTDNSLQDEPVRMTNGYLKSFPQLQPPGVSALQEGASQEDLMNELDKMFETAQASLGYTPAILRRREEELEDPDTRDIMSDATYGVTSEDEREFERFN